MGIHVLAAEVSATRVVCYRKKRREKIAFERYL